MNTFMLYYIWISMMSFIDSHQAFINRYITHSIPKQNTLGCIQYKGCVESERTAKKFSTVKQVIRHIPQELDMKNDTIFCCTGQTLCMSLSVSLSLDQRITVLAACERVLYIFLFSETRCGMILLQVMEEGGYLKRSTHRNKDYLKKMWVTSEL